MPSTRSLRIACALLAAASLLCGPLCVYYCLVAVVLCIIVLSPIFFYCQVSTLTDKSLSQDIDAVEYATGCIFHELLAKQFDEDSVCDYYKATTDRDFMLLELFMGPGMHTCLYAAHPVSKQGGMTRQPALVLAEIRGCDAKRVLEVGCGKGHCSLFLAGACHDIAFRGIDLVAKNVQIAMADAHTSLLPNVDFGVGDSTNIMTENR